MEEIEDVGLPERMFEEGHEPTGPRRINNYYNLKYIQNIKGALSARHLDILNSSQFRLIMEMSDHTFSTNFVHFLLSRQLLTNKEYELWFLFAGKPMRFGIKEFAVVTGLNCRKGAATTHRKKKSVATKSRGTSSDSRSPLWRKMFGEQSTASTNTIIALLRKGRRHKDDDTRFKLALLLLAYGICCPTALPTTIKPEYVDLVEDTEAFLAFPWGRKSFKLTVNSVKGRDPDKFIQKTISIQGFSHSILLVSITACPSIIDDPQLKELCEEEATAADIAECVAELKLVVNIDHAKNVDNLQQAKVESCFGDGVAGLGRNVEFAEEEEDLSVDRMIELINDGCQFDEVVWAGGARAGETEVNEENEATHDDTVESISSDSESESDGPVIRSKNQRMPASRQHASTRRTRQAADATGQEVRMTQQEIKKLVKDMSQDIVAKTEKVIKRYALSIKEEVSKEIELKFAEILSAVNARGTTRTAYDDSDFGDDYNGPSPITNQSPEHGAGTGPEEDDQETEANVDQTIRGVCESINEAFVGAGLDQHNAVPPTQTETANERTPTETDVGELRMNEGEVAPTSQMEAEKEQKKKNSRTKTQITYAKKPKKHSKGMENQETEASSRDKATEEQISTGEPSALEPEDANTVAIGKAGSTGGQETTTTNPSFSLGMDLTQQIRADAAKSVHEKGDTTSAKATGGEQEREEIAEDVTQRGEAQVPGDSVQAPQFDLGISQASTESNAAEGATAKGVAENNEGDERTENVIGTAEDTIRLQQDPNVQINEPFVVQSSLPSVVDTEMPTTQEILAAGIIRLAVSPKKQAEGEKIGPQTAEQKASTTSSTPDGAGNATQKQQKKEQKRDTKSDPKQQGPSNTVPENDRRYSKREKHGPKRFTPEAHSSKQPMVEDERRPPTQEEPTRKKPRTIRVLVGKFNPFASPNTKKMGKFVDQLSVASELLLSTGQQVDNTTFLRVLQSTATLEKKDMEMLVSYAQLRRDKTPTNRYDFIMPSFITEMQRHQHIFAKTEVKETFTFPTRCWNYVVSRPLWFSAVDKLYIPYQMGGRFWVGLLVDLVGWQITVADCHTPEIPFELLHEELNGVAAMLPYFCNKNRLAGDTRVNKTVPFVVAKMILKCNITEQGLDGVATQVIMEQFATRNATDVELLTDELVRCAAMNYALACYFNLQAKPLKI